jgi:hypothetical protein
MMHQLPNSTDGPYRGGVVREHVPPAEHGGEHGVGLPLRERLNGGRVLLTPCTIAATTVTITATDRTGEWDGAVDSRREKGPTYVEEDRGGGRGLRRLHRHGSWPCPTRRFRHRRRGRCGTANRVEGIWTLVGSTFLRQPSASSGFCLFSNLSLTLFFLINCTYIPITHFQPFSAIPIANVPHASHFLFKSTSPVPCHPTCRLQSTMPLLFPSYA